MTASSAQKPIRVLCLDDNRDDRELIQALLEADGLACHFVPTSNRQEFEAALAVQDFDLILSDFTLPGYDGMAALATARKLQAQTPFIFVSGTIGEERAIESLKSGATDYVLKDRTDRLLSSVRRALRETRERAERKLLEDQLRQAQKMEAIGQLAGGVAHDFNNLIAVIRINTELVLLDADKIDAQNREHLVQITEAADRAANLTRQLLAFGRKQALLPRPVNLVDLINNLARMLTRVIGENIRLDFTHDAHPPFVQADPGMLEQVILNLVVNARDAMPQGGRLQLSTKKLRVNARYAQSSSEAAPGDFICLRVRDTGCGIAPEYLHRIFEPFFTTKEAGRGTGLGLATVYGIVKQHHGWIRVSSRVGAGTVFRIFLPAIAPPAAIASTSETEPAALRGSERILLVEDDPSVRLTTRRLLGRYGYQVIEAASGREALEIWQSQQAVIDLVLTDMVMPDGITGRDLADQLRQTRPHLKVVFVSGYSLNVIGNDTAFLTRNKDCFVTKPYQANTLLNIIRRCLDGKSPS